MANWCDNVERIAGPKEQVKPLYEKLTEWIDDDEYPDGVRKGWLGNIVNHSGIEENPDPVTWRHRSRGELIDGFHYEENGDEGIISFSTLTAWGPFPETWYAVLEKHAPDARYYYIASEPGMCIYESNDIHHRFFHDTFMIDCCLWEREKLPPFYAEEFKDMEDGLNNYWYPDEVIGMMEHITGLKIDAEDDKAVDKLIETFEEKIADDLEGDNYINIYRARYYDPEAIAGEEGE